MIQRQRRWALPIAFLAIYGASAGRSAAQQTPAAVKPRLLLVSQPRTLKADSDFVDIGFFLARSLTEAGRYDVIIYKPDEPRIAAAVRAGHLKPGETPAYLSSADAERIAVAIGAVYIVTVSAVKTREGVGAEAGMLVEMGGRRWSSVFADTLRPVRSRSRRPELLEAIHAHVDAIARRIAEAPVVAPGNVTTPVQPTPETVTPPISKPDPQEPTRPVTPPTSEGPKAQPPTTADLLIDRFRRAGDTSNLIVTLRKAVTEHPRDPKLRGELIAALRSRGWNEAARDEATRAVALCPPSANLLKLLGDGYLDTDEPAEALARYREAAALEPGNALYQVAIGDAEANQGHTAEAEVAYKAARTADPRNPLPGFRIARLRAQALRFDEASVELQAAVKASGGADDGEYTATYRAILEIIDGAARDVVADLTALRRDFLAGTVTGEDAHTKAMAAHARSSAIAAYLSDNAVPPAHGVVQALYVQGASLLAQATSAFAAYLETRSESDDRTAALLRQDAARQLEEAAKQAAALAQKRS